jgi:hypothetical protein
MHWLRGSSFSRYNKVSRGAWYSPLFAIDVKGGERSQVQNVEAWLTECRGVFKFEMLNPD